jgi:hypothetical protein
MRTTTDMTTREDIDLGAITSVSRYLTILINLSSFEQDSTPGAVQRSDLNHQVW